MFSSKYLFFQNCWCTYSFLNPDRSGLNFELRLSISEFLSQTLKVYYNWVFYWIISAEILLIQYVDTANINEMTNNQTYLLSDILLKYSNAPFYCVIEKIKTGCVIWNIIILDWKHSSMPNEFHFVPISVETMGVWGPKGYKFIKKAGKIISEKNKEKRSTSFLSQFISMEIQRRNCASVLGTVKSKIIRIIWRLLLWSEWEI